MTISDKRPIVQSLEELTYVINKGNVDPLPKHWLQEYDFSKYNSKYLKIKNDTDLHAKLYETKVRHLDEKFGNGKNVIAIIETQIKSFPKECSIAETFAKYEFQKEYNALTTLSKERNTNNIRIEMYPHPIDFTLCEQAYQKEGVVNAPINKNKDGTIQPGFTLDMENEESKKELELWMNLPEIDIQSLCEAALIDYMNYGNVYAEPVEYDGIITEINLLRPEYVYLDTDGNGRVYGYWEIGEYGQNYYTVDEIIHWKREGKRGNPYGSSLVYPALEMVKRKLNMWENITKILHRYGNPILLWIFGNKDKMQLSKTFITNFMADLKNMKLNSDIGIDYGVTCEVIAAKEGIMDYSPYIRMAQNEVMTTLGCPPIVLGDTANAGGSSPEQLMAWDKSNLARQRALTNGFLLPIFRRYLANQKKLQRKTRLAVIFNEFNRIDRDKQEQNLVKLKESGIKTPNECRRILGDVTKIAYKDPMTNIIDKDYGDYAQPRASGGKNLGVTAPGFETGKLSPKHAKPKEFVDFMIERCQEYLNNMDTKTNEIKEDETKHD